MHAQYENISMDCTDLVVTDKYVECLPTTISYFLLSDQRLPAIFRA
ncbi:Uncharacterised protein [Pseudomonas putida]|nr:hypothetical protein SAMN05216307_5031 [Pseudomonas putida]SMQ01709.1 hypothetical protein SAMN05216380_2576 [Pseudomonas putida]VEE39355.1 Uncharacterised protein [Pseudomonas putida]VTQ43892.1 Uncharacterised protein [Pseudomonas putida]